MKSAIPVCIAAVLCSTAAAQAPTQPSANLVIQPMAQTQLQWRGSGPGRGSVAFCVSSTTGRYALTVNSTTGQGLAGVKPISYSVRFETESDTQHAVLSARIPVVRFHGNVSPDRSCTLGPNVRIVLSLEQADALSANAGSYADHVSLSVEPV